MYCKYCGGKVGENDLHCVHCGSKLEPVSTAVAQQNTTTQPTDKPEENEARTFAIMGFVFSFFFTIVGLILSIVALNKYKKQENQESKGLATAGLVISIVSIAISVLYFFITIIAVAAGI